MSVFANAAGGCCCSPSYLGVAASRKVVGVPNELPPDETWYTNHWRSNPFFDNAINHAIGLDYDQSTEKADLYSWHGGLPAFGPDPPTGHGAYDCGKWDLTETSDSTFANVTKSLVRTTSGYPEYTRVLEMVPDSFSERKYFLVRSTFGFSGALSVLDESGAIVTSRFASSQSGSYPFTTLDDRGNVWSYINGFGLYRNSINVSSGPGFFVDGIAWYHPTGILLIGRNSSLSSTLGRFAFYSSGYTELSPTYSNFSLSSYSSHIPSGAKWSPIDNRVHVAVTAGGISSNAVISVDINLDDNVANLLLTATENDGQSLAGNPIAIPIDDFVV